MALSSRERDLVELMRTLLLVRSQCDRILFSEAFPQGHPIGAEEHGPDRECERPEAALGPQPA